MSANVRSADTTGDRDVTCDISVWSGACGLPGALHDGDRYRCDFCETIPILDHEVHHTPFPHVSGDYDRLC